MINVQLAQVEQVKEIEACIRSAFNNFKSSFQNALCQDILTANLLENAIKADEFYVAVLDRGNNQSSVIGTIRIEIDPSKKRLEFSCLAVDNNHKLAGIGEQLISTAVDLSIANDCYQVCLRIHNSMNIAHKFFKSLGFFDEHQHDGIIFMRKKLGKEAHYYRDFIFPIINEAKNGDSLYFLLHSAYVGHWYDGTYLLDKTISKLMEAKQRGVKLKILVCLRNPYHLFAAYDYLRSFDDNIEIKAIKPESTDDIFKTSILLDLAGKTGGRFTELLAEEVPFKSSLSPKNSILSIINIPYAKVYVPNVTVNTQRNQFMLHWNLNSHSLNDCAEDKLGDYILSRRIWLPLRAFRRYLYLVSAIVLMAIIFSMIVSTLVLAQIFPDVQNTLWIQTGITVILGLIMSVLANAIYSIYFNRK